MKWTVSFILIIVVLVGLVVYIPKVVTITKVDCESQFGPCSQTVEETVSQAVGKNIREAKRTLNDALSANDKVSDFSVSFNLPDQLLVFVVEKKAYAAVAKKDLGTYVLIDQTAQVVGFESETQLPIIALDDTVFEALRERLVVGANLGEDFAFAAALANSLYNLYQTRFGLVTNAAIEFEIKDGIKVIFPREGDAEVLVGSLQLILAKVGRETPINTIDLRFKNPVVK